MTPREVEALCNMVEKEMNQHEGSRIFILNLSPMQTRAEDRILEVAISADYKEPTRLMVWCLADELESMREWLATALYGVRHRNETHTHWRLKWHEAKDAFFEVQDPIEGISYARWHTKRASAQMRNNQVRRALTVNSDHLTVI